ncbi:MAG TPA: DALR anticodon-binding domain-containing protein, partial [Cyclobacteriaceae bacterium]|nr:DALR anticodon-binding domain-containing protein [Cyclobacteriaceae bacterium]
NKAAAIVAIDLLPHEQRLIHMLTQFPARLKEAATEYSPAIIANYAYDLAKEYNQFYQAIPIFAEPDENKITLRIALSGKVGEVIKKSMMTLGIQVPERM